MQRDFENIHFQSLCKLILKTLSKSKSLLRNWKFYDTQGIKIIGENERRNRNKYIIAIKFNATYSRRKRYVVWNRYRVINHGRVRCTAASLNNPGADWSREDRRSVGIRCKSDSLALSRRDGGGKRSLCVETLRRKHRVNLCPSFPRVVIARLRRPPRVTFVFFVNTFIHTSSWNSSRAAFYQTESCI